MQHKYVIMSSTATNVPCGVFDTIEDAADAILKKGYAWNVFHQCYRMEVRGVVRSAWIMETGYGVFTDAQ